MTARVLILEDNAANLELVKYLLNAFGYVPLYARNGKRGLELARLEMPDLILCDVQMPEMDGYEVMRHLKEDPKLRHIPVIAVTAFAMVGDREKMLAAGFNGYISKPITPDTFIQDMETFLPEASRAKPINESAANSSPRSTEPLHGRYTMVVIDDMLAQINLASSIFKYAGYRVFTAQEPVRALSLIREHKPDIIISDVCMPIGSGYELIAAVKREPELQHIPFVFLTSTAMTETERRKGLALGAAKYIFRPIEPEQLLAEIKACVEQ